MKSLIRRKPILIPFFIIMAVAGIALFGWIVMLLWNAVMVAAVGANIITFWQALGLLVLSRILVGGFGGRKNRRSNNNWRGKWMNMTPEERTKFKEDWKQRGGKCYDDAQRADETTEA